MATISWTAFGPSRLRISAAMSSGRYRSSARFTVRRQIALAVRHPWTNPRGRLDVAGAEAAGQATTHHSDRNEAVSILRAAGGRYLLHFRRWSIEQFPG